MRIFTLILSFLFIGTTIFSQVRLDSIIAITVEDFNIYESNKFYYTDDNKIEKIIESDNAVIFPHYNDQNQIDTLLVDDSGDSIYVSFSYEDNLVDTVDFYLLEDNENYFIYTYKYFYDIENRLKQVNTYAYDSGIFFPEFIRNYTYADSGLSDTIKVVVAYNNENFGVFASNYNSDGKRISSYDKVEDGAEFIIYDSINYSGNSINKMYRYGVDSNDEIFIYDEYTFLTEINESYDDIINPFEFYDLIEYIQAGEFRSIFIPIKYSDKVLDYSQSSIYDGEIYTEWFYSFFVNTDEKAFKVKPISVYPNPTTDYLTIDFEQEIKDIKIYDNSTRLVNSIEEPDTEMIDVSTLPSGKYTIIIQEKSGENYFAHFVKM